MSKLSLERLEDRLVLDAYLWRPTGAAALFDTANQWFNTTTGATATVAPGPGTDVTFDNVSAYSCTLNGSSACKTITNTNFTGNINFAASTLNIWGSNSPSFVSTWNAGTFDSSSGGGSLNIIGGKFEYKSNTLNTYSTKTFTTYVSGGGEFTVKGSSPILNSDIKVGYDVGGSNNTNGTFNIDGVGTSFLGNIYEIRVRAGSTLNVKNSISNSNIYSYGDVNLTGGSLGVRTGQTFNVLGGTVNTKEVGIYNVLGNMYVYNATLNVGTANGSYSSLSVSGDLTLGANSTTRLDVNQNSFTQCDSLSADTIHINANATLTTTAKTGAATLSGMHMYRVLDTTALTGTFTTTNHAGNNWTSNYAADYLILNKNIP